MSARDPDRDPQPQPEPEPEPEPDPIVIHVFRDHEGWRAVREQGLPWYEVRPDVLEETYVGTYEFPGWMDREERVAHVRGKHPGCVID